MCISIIFLAWLQDWLPKKERQFWSRGMSFCDQIFLINFTDVKFLQKNVNAQRGF